MVHVCILHGEQLQCLMENQTIFNLERKVARMEENQAKLEAVLKDKEAVKCQSTHIAREHELKEQKMTDKVLRWRVDDCGTIKT